MIAVHPLPWLVEGDSEPTQVTTQMGMRRTVLAVERTGTEEILKGFDLGIPEAGWLFFMGL